MLAFGVDISVVYIGLVDQFRCLVRAAKEKERLAESRVEIGHGKGHSRRPKALSGRCTDSK
jgi:hypothetical protein